MADIDRQNIENQCRLFAYDYIDYRLRRNGFDWSTRPSEILPHDPTDVLLFLRSVCDQFEERYSEIFGTDNINFSSLNLSTGDDLSRTFSDVCHVLFRSNGGNGTEITWGRIFALYAFGGTLAVECANQQLIDRIDDVANLIIDFARTNLVDWIATNGGWDSFRRLYNNRRHEPTSSLATKALSGFGAFCGAVGVVALAAVLVSRH